MSFAGAERAILCQAVGQALSPAPFMDTELTLESTYIREAVGVGSSWLSFSWLPFVHPRGGRRRGHGLLVPAHERDHEGPGGGTGCSEDFFALRAKRCSEHRFLYDITSQSTYSEPDGMAEWGRNRDGESLRQINIGLATDSCGILIAFDIFPGSISDVTTLRKFVSDMSARVSGCTLVMDRGFESASDVAEMMDAGIDFVMPCTVTSKAVRRLLTDFAPDVTKPQYDRMHDGHVYSVRQRTLGMVRDGEGFAYATDDNPAFGESVHRIRAYVCFDSGKRSDDEQELKRALMTGSARLRGGRSGIPRSRSA